MWNGKGDQRVKISTIFNTMRILKRVNPGDAYYENYLGHYSRNGDELYDSYVLMWEIGANLAPKRILEIGTRTGISLCQLLSAYIDPNVIERIVCIDPFNDRFLSPGLVKQNLRHLNLPADKVDFWVAKSKDAIPEIEKDGEQFDYILVDGDHSKEVAREDLEMVNPLLAPGGVVVFDDISTAPGECGLITVWNDFKNQHLTEYDEWHEVMVGKGVAWAFKKE